jgi:hypothetical protein
MARKKALKVALLALGTALQPSKNGSDSMVSQGRFFYIKGLKKMQHAMHSQKRLESAALAGTPHVYAIFEMI